MNRRIIITGILMLLCLSATAREENRKMGFRGCSGGMMVHTGYLSGGDNIYNYNAAGATFGIGGVARVHLSSHFRLGFEGYASTLNLHDKVASGSFNKVFWAGALCDWFWECGRFRPYIGATVGGGNETSYYMFEGDKSDWLPEPDAVFRKQPFFALDPFVGVEYKLKGAIHLTLKADCLLALNSDGLNKPMGPRLYFGIIFVH